MIKETPEIYEKVVKPYIDSIPYERLTWLRNILSHETETEKIVYEDSSPDTGFILIPDLKWDQENLSTLYLLAIVKDSRIRSLRDINLSHLPLLQSIHFNGTKAIETKFGISKHELRLYVHYQPSYYHFHVHFVHIDNTGFHGISIGQAHLLDDIIETLILENSQIIKPIKSFYHNITFNYCLGQNHELFQNLWDATQNYYKEQQGIQLL
ncbi:hypothetical protein CROQUDRAFT_343663 [Cronartium quercuum f. sp. fusiforme G11]|uniref:m7GpppX diphosphatase n=1 Tax=Cronartium quercuum f. sp. fusiforme G11 TaxID=708437 RepID=A0A9P6N6M6_9BASI|nr:hypothetical protein CROQUDRAFT_343663 [Cronartium quercuum f. sp. fusiforme G11]